MSAEADQVNGDVSPNWSDSEVFTGTTSFQPDPTVRNIMVTGGAGFIGSCFVRHMTLTYPEAYHIIVFDKLDYCATLKNTRCLDSKTNFTFIFGDVTDKQAVLRCMQNHSIDTIFHFAAQSHVDLSFGNSFEFTKVNIEGTHVMLESAVKVGVKKFIHISTDEVNGETAHGDADLLEDSILAPTNPYAASKAGAEMYVNAYSKSFKLPCIIIRSNNVYGPHQYPEKVIPKFACLLDRGKPLLLHGNGTNTRRYLFTGDAADAFDTILHKGKVGEIYNVGSHDELSNIELAHKIIAEFNLPAEEAGKWIQHTRDRPFNDSRYAVDANKLRSLGWEQKMPFAEGLKKTVEWYKKFGRTWWPDVEKVLSAFPEVRDGEVWRENDPGNPRATPLPEENGDAKEGYFEKGVDAAKGVLLSVPNVVVNGAVENGNQKKRSREAEDDKENVMDRAPAKKAMIGDDLNGGEVVR